MNALIVLAVVAKIVHVVIVGGDIGGQKCEARLLDVHRHKDRLCV